jgi:transposase InsO family protein
LEICGSARIEPTAQTLLHWSAGVAALIPSVRASSRKGYRRIAVLLRRDGEGINDKRMYRLWKAAGLEVPRKRCKKTGNWR